MGPRSVGTAIEDRHTQLGGLRPRSSRPILASRLAPTPMSRSSQATSPSSAGTSLACRPPSSCLGAPTARSWRTWAGRSATTSQPCPCPLPAPAPLRPQVARQGRRRVTPRTLMATHRPRRPVLQVRHAHPARLKTEARSHLKDPPQRQHRAEQPALATADRFDHAVLAQLAERDRNQRERRQGERDQGRPAS